MKSVQKALDYRKKELVLYNKMFEIIKKESLLLLSENKTDDVNKIVEEKQTIMHKVNKYEEEMSDFKANTVKDDLVVLKEIDSVEKEIIAIIKDIRHVESKNITIIQGQIKEITTEIDTFDKKRQVDNHFFSEKKIKKNSPKILDRRV
jgi:flagellar biosynthesis/type III secretory pathway chaperone